jgi:hypothetical protein
MVRLTGLEGRPYPNVIGYRLDNGRKRYAARYPVKRRMGKRMSQHLGMHDTAERAYLAVLDARVEDSEYRTNQWRRERDIHVGNIVCKKRGRPRKENVA